MQKIMIFNSNKLCFYFLIFLVGLCCNSEKARNIKHQKTWASYLKREPIPNNAKKLKLIDSMPKKENLKDSMFLSDPAYIFRGPDNYIYISDIGEHAIFKIDPSGKIQLKIGRYGQGPKDFAQPQFIGSDIQHNIYVFDGGNQRIQVMNQSWDFLRSFKLFKPCFSMDVDEEGTIYVALFDNNYQFSLINIYDSWGRDLGEMGTRLEASEPGPFNDVDISAYKNEIYVAWRTFPIIRKYSKSGSLIYEHRLDYGLMKEFGEINRTATRENGRVNLWGAISKIRAYSDGYYVLRTFPRLEILSFDISGKIREVYWKDTSYDYFASDFFVSPEDGGIKIYVLEGLPEPRVAIYGEENKPLIGKYF